ncbi:SigE family RNA polymerase sigma factor [Nakamurella sp. YIM 132087]|uniref:SigE family RNA polymerase sigma factor n=1 Tax=Nakamurella alba TaxID=2665158 RepID=A0A7K1FFD6_9ACTN|nr:SigE family RNA polymerase sigma factor [Nakamurella alba]MTD12817.1 SigE family RNA polymerase sigma factor [Nakamurella alba]
MEFEVFVQREIAGLTRFAGVLTGDRQLAHDVLADALIAAHARWSRIATLDHPLAYVRRMVTTTFLADRRKVTRRRTDPTDDPTMLDQAVPDPSETVQRRDETSRLLALLPDRQRAALVLRYYLDLPDPAIADVLGCAPATVRSHISQALAALRAGSERRLS